MRKYTPHILTISPTHNFAEELAKYCDALAIKEGISLSIIKIFLPTRRGIRTLQEAFLRLSKGKPRILPIMQSIGDADLEEAGFHDSTLYTNIPPAISPLRRQIMLARMIAQKYPEHYTDQQAMGIASDLGQLIDQIHTEDKSIHDLNDIMQETEFAQYWEITVSFLTQILGELWPVILEAEGMIDPGLHRKLRIEALTEFYKSRESKSPVIVAGTTGSLKATREFVKTILGQDQGYVILPGFDTLMDDQTWMEVGDGHPQYLLKQLIEYCNIDRGHIQSLGEIENSDRFFVMSEMMRPATISDKWQEFDLTHDRQKIKNGVQNVMLCEADHDHHEATAIAVAMAEIANDPDQEKTATFITPDRYLAMRVQSILKQWNIDIDDSGGTSLTKTPIGHFCLSAIQSIINNQIEPIPFLSTLKSKYCGDKNFEGEFRSKIRLMERSIFRGIKPQDLFLSLSEKYSDLSDLLSHINSIYHPVIAMQEGQYSLKNWITIHVSIVENLAQTENSSGADRLWIGDAGEAMAMLFSNLLMQNDVAPDMTLSAYIEFLEMIMGGESFTAKYGKHPRLSILGQIESRMVSADRVILGGLNEGVWPPESGFDAWMSRHMRARFELPSLEQKTTLSAHDFASGFCAHDVIITRSNKTGGQPTLPSRWIQRLKTVLQAARIERDQWPDHVGQKYLHWAKHVRLTNHAQTIERPRPTPPCDIRPRDFSVTEIEKWMRDPYFIYAKKILKLRALDDVDREMTMADRGTLIHTIMEKFTQQFDTPTLPDDALNQLLLIGKTEFANYSSHAEIQGLWWPRFEKTAAWFIEHEQTWRKNVDQIFVESKGVMEFQCKDITLSLSGKADRIETHHDYTVAIIDYKTGAPPSPKDVNLGIASQLPLEALIQSQNGFDKIRHREMQDHMLSYWQLNGSGDGGTVTSAQGTRKAKPSAILIEEAYAGLNDLFAVFHNANTPYIASPDPQFMMKQDYNDYAHLERIAEWSVMDDSGDDYGSGGD